MGREAQEERAREVAPLPAHQRRSSAGLIGCGFLLAGIAVVAYANSFRVPFLLDDARWIGNNSAVGSSFSLPRILSSNRPVVTLSLAVNRVLGGFDVTGYHAVNFLAHLACGLLLFALTRYTLRRASLRERFAGGAASVALVATSIFLLHPIQTGAVTYIIQRTEIFAALALLASVWIASVAVETGRLGRAIPPLVMIGALGAWSKQTMLALPLVFAVYDRCFLREVRGRRWPVYLTLGVAVAIVLLWSGAEIRSGFLLAAAGPWPSVHFREGAQLVTMSALPDLGLQDFAPAGIPPATLSPWQYLSMQFGTVLYYFRLVALPNRLCFDCGYPVPSPVLHSVLGDRVVLPALVLLGAATAAWRSRERHPLLAFAILAPLAALVPSSSAFPLSDVYFEHRLYLPIALLALPVAAAAFRASDAIVQRGWLARRTMNALGITAVMAVWVTLGALTFARNGLLGDPLRLWQDTVARAPEQPRARLNLGNELMQAGDLGGAAAQYTEAIRLRPGYAAAYYDLGNVFWLQGRAADAVKSYEDALRANPKMKHAHYNLGNVLLAQGRVEDAIAEYNEVLRLDPAYENARIGLRIAREHLASTGRNRM